MIDVATDFIAYQEAVKTRLHRQRLYNQFWSPMMGKVVRKEYTENGQVKYSGIPSGNVIERQDFMIDGYKDTVLVPMLLNLTQAPGYGDQYLVGTGEKAELKYMRGALNQVSAVVNVKDGNMSRYRDMGSLRIYREAMELLTLRMMEFDNGHIISSIYEQHSSNVTAGLSVAPNGIGMTAHYHPNMYVNQIATDGSSGILDVVGTEKMNKTAAEIYTEVLTNYASITHPSVYLLEAISRKLVQLKIKPIKYWGGKPLFLMVVDTPTFYRLRRDTTIKTAIESSWTGAKNFNNPMFAWDYFVYDKFLIVMDELSARSFDTTTSTFSGSTGRYYDLPTLPTSYENCCINVMGASAVGLVIPGEAGKLHTENEKTNFNQNEETAAFSIYGATRGEFVNEDRMDTYYAKKNSTRTFGAAETEEVTNQSSMQVIAKRVA